MLDFFPPIWNGTLREHYLLLFGAAGSIALVTGLAGAWIGALVAGRRMRLDLLAALRQEDARRSSEVAELVGAVDVVSVELERLAEAQRYTAKLLADRAEQVVLPPRREPQSITPH